MALNPLVTAITPPQGSSGGAAETEVPLLEQIVNLLANSGGGASGFIVVNGVAYAYDWMGFTYYGSTNNVKEITYKSGGSGGTTVAVQRFNYAGGGASNDDLVTVIATTTS